MPESPPRVRSPAARGEPFVGRDAELGALEEVLAAAAAGSGRFTLISGEPGIGKTRLAQELSRHAEARGFARAWGRAWEGAGTPAYFPWLQALRRLEAVPALERHVEAARTSAPEIAALFGATAEVVGGADPEQARFRLFDAVAALLRRASATAPLLVVLDDLHAADVSTLLMLRFVARDLEGCRLMLVGTVRDAGTATPDVLAQVAREALVVPLGRLARADVVRWVEAKAPELATRVDAWFARSEGNPLFVEELLASGKKGAGAGAAPIATMPLGIREAIRAHLALVSDAVRRLLEVGSALGRDFPVAALAAVAAAPADAVRALVDEALAARVLSDEGDGQLHFAHVLLRDELYAGLTPARRAELHRAAARWFARDPAAVATAAHHHLLGARPDDAADAARTALAAVDDAAARFAFEDAADLAERAVAALAPNLSPAEEIALQVAAGRAHILAGAKHAGRMACARAAAIARAIGDVDALAAAALAHATEVALGRDDASVDLLEKALAGLPDEDAPRRVEVMSRLSVAMVPALPHEGDRAAQLSREAMAMARRLGDERALFAALRTATVAFPEAFAAHERIALNAEAIALAERLGQVALVVPLFAWQVAWWLEVGDRARAARDAEVAERLVSAFPQPHYRWRTLATRAVLAGLEGRFEEADGHHRALLDVAEHHELEDAVRHACVVRLMLAHARGDGDDLAEHEALIGRMFLGPGGGAPFYSLVDALRGRRAAVGAALERARTLNLDGLPGAFTLGWPCAIAGLTEHAAFFYDLATRRAAGVTMLFAPAGTTMGPTALMLGRLAALMGRDADAARHLEEGLAVATNLGARPYVAQAELALAELRLAAAPASARGHAERARELSEALGMRGVRERAEAILAGSAAAPRPVKAPAAAVSRTVALARRGELWALEGGATTLLLRDAKGLAYLEALVRSPHREIHVLEMVGAVDGDAGPLLDARAKADYRRRAEDLRETLAEATANGDLGRAGRAREELEALAEELARAVGLGGRDRRAASGVERARINVQRRLRDVIQRVADQDRALGRHLELSVRTGVFCLYAPTWPDEA